MSRARGTVHLWSPAGELGDAPAPDPEKVAKSNAIKAKLKKLGSAVIEMRKQDPNPKKNTNLMAAEAFTEGSSYQYGTGIKTYVSDDELPLMEQKQKLEAAQEAEPESAPEAAQQSTQQA